MIQQLSQEAADAQEEEVEYIRLENGMEWCTLQEATDGDRREMEGLWRRGVFSRPEGPLPSDAVVIDSRMVRNWKGLLIKSRLVIRDFAITKAAGGEFFAATPSVGSLRLMLCLGSADMNACVRKNIKYVAAVLDVSQAFPHAALDEEVYTILPQCLDGLT